MKEIVLSKQQVALVDDEDYEFLNQWKWCVLKKRNGTYYAVRAGFLGLPVRKKILIYMHRVILNAIDNVKVDHRDNNGLNNQKYNLRLATNSQNKMNQGLRADSRSGFKGVSWNENMTKWQASIRVKGKLVILGYFDDLVKAAKIYDFWARDIHGEFVYPNFKL